MWKKLVELFALRFGQQWLGPNNDKQYQMEAQDMEEDILRQLAHRNSIVSL